MRSCGIDPPDDERATVRRYVLDIVFRRSSCTTTAIEEAPRSTRNQGLDRVVARACSLGVGTVTLYLQRADRGVSWCQSSMMLRRGPSCFLGTPADRVRPDCAEIHRELTPLIIAAALRGPSRRVEQPVLRDLDRRLRPSMGCTASARRPSSTSRASGRLDRHTERDLFGWREQLHLRRGDGDPAGARLGRRPHPDGRILRGATALWVPDQQCAMTTPAADTGQE